MNRANRFHSLFYIQCDNLLFSPLFKFYLEIFVHFLRGISDKLTMIMLINCEPLYRCSFRCRIYQGLHIVPVNWIRMFPSRYYGIFHSFYLRLLFAVGYPEGL